MPYINGQVGDKELIFDLLNGSHELTSSIRNRNNTFCSIYISERKRINPLIFYENNFTQTLNLLEILVNKNERDSSNIPIVFSSSC